MTDIFVHEELIKPIPQMVEKALRLKFENDGREDTDPFVWIDLQDLHVEYERKSPYIFCKDYGLLVNNSAEEFSLEFMEYFNKYIHYY